MSRPYNTKHPDRSRTDDTKGYRKRLQARGLGKAPRMSNLDDLRARQDRRIRESCTLIHVHDGVRCNGQPFPLEADLHDSDLETGGEDESSN